MNGYLPNTDQERAAMLERLGMPSVAGLFSAVPADVLCKDGVLPPGKSELETMEQMAGLAEKSHVFRHIFRGAGAYNHFIPPVVSQIAANPAFVTAYTPYQPEISQGILQSIFEYQSMICRLTGMDVSNASVYDGATAAAEAASMCRSGKRTVTYVSGAVHPMVLGTLRTYAFGGNAEVRVLPTHDGVTDLTPLTVPSEETASVLLQQPNFFGCLEDVEAAARKAHEAGAKLIVSLNPIAAAVLTTPGTCGADIAVGEAQPLGLPLSFGGPYLGFMAATASMMRKLPGRIVGQTVDGDGNRAFVLTLQAREQHIRREKAGSNICSNEALCALTAGAYMAAMGPGGMAETAMQCYQKAHYLAGKLGEAGLTLRYPQPFFHEFVTNCPQNPETLLARLAEKDILGGLPLDGGILWCATEKNSKDEIDSLAAAVKEGF